jgi:hypothetical protein
MEIKETDEDEQEFFKDAFHVIKQIDMNLD